MKHRPVMYDAVQMNFLLPLAMRMMMMMMMMMVCVCVNKKYVILHITLNNKLFSERNFYLQHIHFVYETHKTELSPIPFVHVN